MINVNHSGIIASSQTAADGGAFTPADVTSATLVSWYDASDAGTITESSGLVSQWNDKSGNGHHQKQGTGSLQPSTGTRTIGGKNALDFQSDLLTADSSYTPGQTWTAVYVLEADAFSSSQFISGFNSNNHTMLLSTTTFRVRSGSARTVTVDTTLSTGTPYIVVVRYTHAGTIIDVWFNGTTSDGQTIATAANNVCKSICSTDGTTSSATMAISAFSTYLGAISDAEINSLGNAYGDTYSITWNDI